MEANSFKPIFLIGPGNCGFELFVSLLDNHEEIVVMPYTLKFYHLFNILKLDQETNAKKIKNILLSQTKLERYKDGFYEIENPFWNNILKIQDLSKFNIKLIHEKINLSIEKRKTIEDSEENINKKKNIISVDVPTNKKHISKREFKYLSEDIKKFEPRIALDGGNDGLDLIKKVIYKTKDILKINGTLALEIGNKQFRKVSKILINNNFKIEFRINDYRDNIRCVIAKKLK